MCFLELKMHCEHRVNDYELEGPTLSVDRAHEYYKSPDFEPQSLRGQGKPSKKPHFSLS